MVYRGFQEEEQWIFIVVVQQKEIYLYVVQVFFVNSWYDIFETFILNFYVWFLQKNVLRLEVMLNISFFNYFEY